MKSRAAGGISLIEVVVSVVLLGILSATTATLLPTLLAYNRQSLNEELAAASAQEILEGLLTSWTTTANYNAACLTTVPETPVGFQSYGNAATDSTLQWQDADDSTSSYTTILATGATCPSTPATQPKRKRVRIELKPRSDACTTTSGCSTKTFILDIGSP